MNPRLHRPLLAPHPPCQSRSTSVNESGAPVAAASVSEGRATDVPGVLMAGRAHSTATVQYSTLTTTANLGMAATPLRMRVTAQWQGGRKGLFCLLFWRAATGRARLDN